jgi:tetratricopeptide (TPR) repeat protein
MVCLPSALRLVPVRVCSGSQHCGAPARGAYGFDNPGSMYMCFVAARSIFLAALFALTLAGCKTDGSFEFFGANEQPAPSANVALEQPPAPLANSFEEQELAPPPVAEQQPVYNNPANNSPRGEALLGNNPADDVRLGKKHYREQNFGLAERHFRRAVEAAPQNAEAWMGLAASYDKLRRFDLADRAYSQAFAIRGATPELLNNHGYSYILRGDYKNARIKLAEAKSKDPNSKYIQNNIDLLEDSVRNAR